MGWCRGYPSEDPFPAPVPTRLSGEYPGRPPPCQPDSVLRDPLKSAQERDGRESMMTLGG